MAVQFMATNGLDGAGEDLLAGAALAGDEDADVGGGDAAGEGEELAHLADGDGLAVVERQFVDEPEGGALLALEARAFEVVNGVDEEFDRVDGRDGLDVRPALHLDFNAFRTLTNSERTTDRFDVRRRVRACHVSDLTLTLTVMVRRYCC
jgi:hypothetical protein